MKQNKGFTLIEMLVVVGMIGVLAAAVLTALGPSRNKAKDSRIISDVNQIAALAEVLYDGNNFPTSNVLLANPITKDAAVTVNADINKLGGALKYLSDTNGNFAVYSRLVSDQTRVYCVDSAGAHRIINNPGALVVVCPIN